MNAVRSMVRKYGPKLALVAPVAIIAAQSANAALDPAIGTMLTGVSADASSLFSLGWPVFAVIAGGFVLFKLAKRVLGKVT